jgi:hypothetical protein
MARYIFHAITREDFRLLVSKGFLLKEIDKLNNAKTPSGDYQKIDLKEKVYQDWMNSRAKFWRKAHRKGMSAQKIRARIKRLYIRKGYKTPFDFIKEEYKKGLDKSQDYLVAEKSSRSNKAGSRGNPKGR